MGKLDARTNEYLSDNGRFADIINYYVYGGKQIIKPEQLHEMDTRELVLPYGEENAGYDTIQRYRDILKYASAMTDGDTAYLIVGAENQGEVQYSMPVKGMLYDSAQYAKQVAAAAKSHKKGKDKTAKPTSGEFLSGFYKGDKLIPVITLVVFWSADKWDGPLFLHEMLSVQDEDILKYVPDYKINLIAPYHMADADFGKFQTSLAEVFRYIKYSGDKAVLRNILEGNAAYRHMDRETADLINEVTGSTLTFDKGEEKVNMCIAIDEMREEAVKEATVKIAEAFIALGKNTIEEIAMATKLTVEEVENLKSEEIA